MLGLVAPVTMSADQQTLWLASAMDAMRDIRLDEIEAVSVEVRRTVSRPSQIVPEIARLVGEKRARRRSIDEAAPLRLPGPPIKRHIADRDRRSFNADDWAELNEHLERMGATKRYRSDGTKYDVQSSAGGK
jgi:hypothetical protein